MKKRLVPIAASIILAMSVLPVSAEGLSNENPAGNTEVTARVSSSGDVTYLISIPDEVDFGVLQQPEDNTDQHWVMQPYIVQAIQITGLDTDSRVAVLLKDPTKNGGFQITGQSTANKGKALIYSVYNEAETDITSGRPFPNGYLLAVFGNAGDTVDGQLKLDQNQLYGRDLDEWVGSYTGTINFYSRVVSLKDIQ